MIAPRVGDVVRVKGERLRMIITRVNYNGTIEVYWFVGHIKRTQTFENEELEKCYV